MFTIEDKILKELKQLIEKAKTNGKLTDSEIKDKNNKLTDSDIKQIWKERINAAIQDWKNTLNGRLQISTLQKRLLKK